VKATDFLKRGADTPLCEYFDVSGGVCEIRTNNESILRAARESYLPLPSPAPEAKFRLRFWVDSRTERKTCWPVPYIRRSGHLVFAAFDSGNAALIHLGSRHVIGRFSTAFAEDRRYWKEKVLPILFSIVDDASDVVWVETPHVTLLPVMDRVIRLETNDVRILERAEAACASYAPASCDSPHFLWRIVTQPSLEDLQWSARTAFSDQGLRFAEFGQTNFIAVDLNTREGVSYVADRLVKDEFALTSPLLDHLFSMTAGGLGLTSLFAACVGRNGKALLVAGPPNNGKTSASYIAARNGLEFHADRAVFLETNQGRLRAWGDFWPAAFRQDGPTFYPELHSSTQPFRYCDFNFLLFDKRVYQTLPVRAVTPVGCVFLERRPVQTPTLSRIPTEELSRRLDGLDTFQDDSRFDAQRAAVMTALQGLPAHQFVFDDPADAAKVFGDLLGDVSPSP